MVLLVPVQEASEQRPHKLSYHLSAQGEAAQKVISQLDEALKAVGVRAKIIYSGSMDVDILPEGASKGEGLNFLLRQVRLGAKDFEDAPLTAALSELFIPRMQTAGSHGILRILTRNLLNNFTSHATW